MKNNFIIKILLLLLFVSSALSSQNSYWTLHEESTKITRSEDEKLNLNKESYKIYGLNFQSFVSQLKQLSSRSSNKKNLIVSFPNQYGKLEDFSIVETQIMSPSVANEFPNIKTYLGFGIDNSGARIRFSVSPQGVQAMTSYPDKPWMFTVPFGKGEVNTYISYDRTSRIDGKDAFICSTEVDAEIANKIGSFRRGADDQILRTFRIAVSTTAEYTNFWDDGDDTNGDAKSDAMAQVVSTMNRVNEVFEIDMAINFQLVSEANVIYDDPNTDPYNRNPRDFSSDLETTLINNVGASNYDLGHLFHKGSINSSDLDDGNNGSAGCIGCVCQSDKGRGFSQHIFRDNNGGPYMSDFFDIDYVSHEIGHQMGANHTWSFDSEGTGVNYEPGSGTTIMGYAGITGSNDVQDHSDPYFHYASIQQILENVMQSPNNCWTSTAISNNPPQANAGIDYIIPAGTPFMLKGAATDADETDVLTYTWEQIDNGVTDFLNFRSTKATGAIFRSRPPSTSPNRYMPILSRILRDRLTEINPVETIDNTSWETISSVSRDLNFALTVRDRSTGVSSSSSPQSSFDTMRVRVDGSTGPFMVTSQNTSEVWEKCSIQNIAWDVAGTDMGNVNVSTVDILLSIDGGLTYPFKVGDAVANDGSYNIVVPDVGLMEVNTVRIMVAANDNIFFAVNDTDITIQNPTASTDDCVFESFSLFPNPSNGAFNLSFDSVDLNVSLKVFDLKGTLIKNLNYDNVNVRFSERVDLGNIAGGVYVINITNGVNSVFRKILIE